jgi:hypothetical protein
VPKPKDSKQQACAPSSLILACCFSGIYKGGSFQMRNWNLGNWDSALFKSLFTSSLLIPFAYLAYSFQLNNLNLSELAGLLVSFLLYIGVFILISLIGWIFIGFPIPCLLCRLRRTNYFYYGFLPTSYICKSYFTNGPWLFGFIALANLRLKGLQRRTKHL